MAIVRKLTQVPLERDSPHLEAECTYTLVRSSDGVKYLQLDTYGSSARKLKGKKSQSLRLAPSAIKQLKDLLNELF